MCNDVVYGVVAFTCLIFDPENFVRNSILNCFHKWLKFRFNGLYRVCTLFLIQNRIQSDTRWTECVFTVSQTFSVFRSIFNMAKIIIRPLAFYRLKLSCLYFLNWTIILAFAVGKNALLLILKERVVLNTIATVFAF